MAYGNTSRAVWVWNWFLNIFWKKLAHATWQMTWYFFEGQEPCLYGLDAEIFALIAFTQKFKYVAHKLPQPFLSSLQAVPIER